MPRVLAIPLENPSEIGLIAPTEHTLGNAARVRCGPRGVRQSAVPPTVNRDALYSEFQPLVRRLIRQYGDTPEMRQDLSGEIYCRFCGLLEAYDPARGVPLRPYLVRQLTASVYTYARAGWRSHKREVSLEAVSGIREIGEEEDPSREWDERLSNEQVLRGLPEAIAKLPKRQRQVLIWRYYEERSFEEIATLLDVQLATTRSLLRHAISNLRKGMTAAADARG